MNYFIELLELELLYDRFWLQISKVFITLVGLGLSKGFLNSCDKQHIILWIYSNILLIHIWYIYMGLCFCAVQIYSLMGLSMIYL